MIRFHVEQREASGKPYLKVSLTDKSIVLRVKAYLELLPSVRKANEHIEDNPHLIVYPNKCYSIEDCIKEVNKALPGFEANVVENTHEAEIKAHFEQLESQLLSCLNEAGSMIDVCVAWFTNPVLKDKLIEKRAQGVKIRIIRYKDGVNAAKGVDLSTLEFKEVRGERGGIMHEKFCVIDNYVVIAGSYNWTANAEHRNDEDFNVSKGNIQLANSYTRRFNQIWDEN